MPFPRVRFTVRRLMVAVVVVACGLWCVHMTRLSRWYAKKAETFKIYSGDPFETNRAVTTFWERMTEKYDRASRRPWLGVEPDPPYPYPGLPLPFDPPEPE